MVNCEREALAGAEDETEMMAAAPSHPQEGEEGGELGEQGWWCSVCEKPNQMHKANTCPTGVAPV